MPNPCSTEEEKLVVILLSFSVEMFGNSIAFLVITKAENRLFNIAGFFYEIPQCADSS